MPLLVSDVDLRARRAAGVGVVAGGGDAKLLDRIQRRAQDAGKGVAVRLVVVVEAVEGGVVLVGARARVLPLRLSWV